MGYYSISNETVVANNKLVTYTRYSVPTENTYVINKILEDETWWVSCFVGEYTILTKVVRCE